LVLSINPAKIDGRHQRWIEGLALPAGVEQTSLERRQPFWVFPGRTGQVSLFCEQEPDALRELS
jgi:hypothetical protein